MGLIIYQSVKLAIQIATFVLLKKLEKKGSIKGAVGCLVLVAAVFPGCTAGKEEIMDTIVINAANLVLVIVLVALMVKYGKGDGRKEK